ncbi:hypothetical protein DL767_010055 [Monosporascus sp. MG133]|nr:hypothetical protein DL767_010055 [Monosporascus sp. MG133]
MSLNLNSPEMRKVDVQDVSTVAYLSTAFYLISFVPRSVVEIKATVAGRFGLDYEQMPEGGGELAAGISGVRPDQIVHPLEQALYHAAVAEALVREKPKTVPPSSGPSLTRSGRWRASM